MLVIKYYCSALHHFDSMKQIYSTLNICTHITSYCSFVLHWNFSWHNLMSQYESIWEKKLKGITPYLVSCQVGFKGFVLLLESLELIEFTVTEVLALQHFLLTRRPGLVDLGLVLELLGQMFQTLQPWGTLPQSINSLWLVWFIQLNYVNKTENWQSLWKLCNTLVFINSLYMDECDNIYCGDVKPFGCWTIVHNIWNGNVQLHGW